MTALILAGCAVTLAAVNFPKMRQQWRNARDVIEMDRQENEGEK